MTIALTRVKDIGPVAAEALAEHGIASVEVLASLSASQLSEVPGFGALRAERVIAAARSLLGTVEMAGLAPGEKAGPRQNRKKSAAAGKKDKKSKDKKKKGKGKSGAKRDPAGKGAKKRDGKKNKGKGGKKKSAKKKGGKKGKNKK